MVKKTSVAELRENVKIRINSHMNDRDLIDTLTQRIHELEAQCRLVEATQTSLAQEVMQTVLALAQENEICYTALCEILELQTGTVAIAEDAIVRILDLRHSLNS